MKYLLFACLLLPAGIAAAQSQPPPRSTEIPRLVRYSGVLRDTAGAAHSGTVAATFAIYGEQTGGSPLWQETQNVQLDSQGRYSVVLGSASALPAAIFTNNEARWLGVQVLADAEPEQVRVLLVSVPYALKAQDAETLGGRPASAYVLNAALGGLTTGAKGKYTGGQAAAPTSEGPVNTSTAVTTNAIPKFSATDTLADSMMMELYNQSAADAFGFALPNEDVLRLGDGSGLPKSFHVAGRVVSQGFDMNTSAANSLHIVNTNANGLAMQANADGSGFSTAMFGSSRSFNGAGATFFSFPPIGGGSPAPGDYSVAMYSANYNAQGVGVQAWSPYDGAGGAADPVLTGPIGLYAAAAHSTGIAAVLDQRAAGGGKLLSGRANGTEVISMTTAGNITASGAVTAASFSGNGLGLTGVTASTAAALASDPAACASNKFATDIAADGTLTCTQPSSSNLSDVASLATKAYADAGDSTEASARSLVDAKLAVRGINYLAGCDSCNLLQTLDSQKTIYMNVVGPMTISQVTCFSDAGSPTINLQRDDGSAANILTSDLACSVGGATAPSVVGAESVLALSDKIDFYVTGGTGVAHRVTVVIKTTVN